MKRHRPSLEEVPPKKPALPKRQKSLKANSADNKLARAEQYIQQRYEVRFNVVKGVVEWRPAGSSILYEPLNDYQLNSILRELAHNQCAMGSDGLNRLLASDFSPRVDPLQEYFTMLGTKPAATGHIAKLAATVKLVDSVVFTHYLTKWLVATIANALTPVGCQNHTCLVLTGGQGQYKTTWLELLCPPPLAVRYLFTGKLQVENKDTQSMLAEYFFINIDDQLCTINKRDENSLKTLITQPSVKLRRPYDRLIAELPRRASFMGSVNGADFLTDPTGSRRFLPFQIEAINIEAARQIDLEAVWSEAYHLWQTGFQYWFDEDELDALHERNRQFQQDTPEYELVVMHFEPGKEFYTLAQIKEELQLRSTVRNLRERFLGEALARLGIPRQQKRLAQGGRVGGYYVQALGQRTWAEDTLPSTNTNH
ncbi:virulence-associated E family protein [Hymenobacter tibetensis]|uniref:Virulence-associated E family protein n=1 Tax=Hymenobacter tibetensis TaxID=497967 RepID=A0ABY4CWU1_9BACT|nr:virulence-associated E family protein [Hymenobacter tibetensis]UOG73481.1 virulence-associated E family protein [Hymenobacter tibetensis]